MNDGFIVYTKDMAFVDGIICIPIYMAMFLLKIRSIVRR